ncbi:rhodanese-like domain-containing protein [Microaerobacter geothermalis]|uniref:rhodanese-like domain-containing protein n=1 Tax=Microaerobacter geothermalis TaxID=674972 RepID=UPI001F4810F6|nr:rhodanese-like domain-containing protein [Microaerobacter geothermalis]MCF6094995.1 rhodanese-like domain-containing protein [Microaerobacter geothermalis]
MGWTEIVFILLVITFIIWRMLPVKGLIELQPNEFKEKMKSGQLIDVRTESEYRNGHIPGSINIPLHSLRRNMGKISKEKEVLLYCQSGMRSKKAAKILIGKTKPVCYHLKGGISNWPFSLKK